jgi:hypothetical protein
MQRLLLLLAFLLIASPGYGETIPVFSADKNGTSQTVTAITLTQLTWPHTVFDTNSNFASNAFTPTIAGKYFITAMAGCPNATSGCSIWLLKNGVQIATGYQGNAATSAGGNIAVSAIVDMSGTDSITVSIYDSGTTVDGQVRATYFSGSLVGNGSIYTNVINSDGRLTCSGAGCANSTGSTTLAYCPYKGNSKTTASQGVYTIPSSCLTATTTSMYLNGAAGTSLAASTTYYIYLWNNSGTWVLDASTTGHATDSTTGIEIKSGANTRTLVGMIHTDASKKVFSGGQTSTSGDTNTVATWDNRKRTQTRCTFGSTNQSVTSATPAEVNSNNRCRFMSWGDGAIFDSIQNGDNNHASAETNTFVSLDTATTSGAALISSLSLTSGIVFEDTLLIAPGMIIPSEGFHFTVISADVTATSTLLLYGGTQSYVYTMQ